MIQFQETTGQKEEWKDGETLFHRTFLATAKVPKNISRILIHSERLQSTNSNHNHIKRN